MERPRRQYRSLVSADESALLVIDCVSTAAGTEGSDTAYETNVTTLKALVEAAVKLGVPIVATHRQATEDPVVQELSLHPAVPTTVL